MCTMSNFRPFAFIPFHSDVNFFQITIIIIKQKKKTEKKKVRLKFIVRKKHMHTDPDQN